MNLDWQAFAYYSDELSPDEREAFEQLLADDQDAREALARVVELSHAVIAAESLAPTADKPSPACKSQPGRSRRIVAWVAAVAASAAALVVGVSIGSRGDWSSPVTGGQSVAGKFDPALASAWSETRLKWDEITAWQPLATASLAEDETVDEATDDGSDELAPQFASDWDAADLEAPSWMTAAVVGQAAEMTTPPDIEQTTPDSLPTDSTEES